MEQMIYDAYLDILREELVPAMGCTEPIAVAYAAALARQTLGKIPEQVELVVSGNIIKNVKSVIVPHTGGRKGLRTAVAAGVCFGAAERELEVLSDASEEQLKDMDAWLAKAQLTILESEALCPFDLSALHTCVPETMDISRSVLIPPASTTIFMITPLLSVNRLRDMRGIPPRTWPVS